MRGSPGSVPWSTRSHTCGGAIPTTRGEFSNRRLTDESWPEAIWDTIAPGVPDEHRKALLYRALGAKPKELAADADLGLAEARAVYNATGPDSRLADAVYAYWADRAAAEEEPVGKYLRQRLSILGLDALGGDPDYVESILGGTNITAEGTVLRLILWAADSSADIPSREDQGKSPAGYAQSVFGLPGRLLIGDGLTQFVPDDEPGPQVTAKWSEDLWTPLSAYEPGSSDWWFAAWALGSAWSQFLRAIEEGKAVWNGRLVRIRDCQVLDLDDPSKTRLHANLQRTTYVAQRATHFSFRDWPHLFQRLESSAERAELVAELRRRSTGWQVLLDEQNAQPDPTDRLASSQRMQRLADAREDLAELLSLTKRLDEYRPTRQRLAAAAAAAVTHEKECLSEGRLADSRFANALSINVTYLTADGYLLVQRRNKAGVGHGLVDWQTSAAGFLALPRDRQAQDYPRATHRTPSVWLAARHETVEEMGVDFRPRSVSVLGIAWEARNFELGFLAVGELDQDWAQLRVSPGLDQKTEVLGYQPVPIGRADALFRLLTSGSAGNDPWSNVMPLGAFSMLAAMALHFGGWSPLERAWTRIRQPER